MKRLLAALLIAGLAYAVYVAAGIPSRSAVRALVKKNPDKSAVMRQREQEARQARRQPRHAQSWIPLAQVSRHLIHAVVAAEDPNFFGHAGVDWDAVKESLETNVRKASFARGGSTITQQLAKNLFFTTSKTITRKLRELVVARWLEQDLSKRRILELYLNVIEWGDGVYGCQAAAQRYYGKSVAALSATEAAGLAAMIPSPRRINPRVDPARHARAQKRVLWLMAGLGYVERSVGGLGTEPPPPEVVTEDDEPLVPEAEALPEELAPPATLELEPSEPPSAEPPAPEPSPRPASEPPPPSDAPTPSPSGPPPPTPARAVG